MSRIATNEIELEKTEIRVSGMVKNAKLLKLFARRWNNAMKHVVAIAATLSISLATVFYPISIILMNVAFVSMMLYRGKQIHTSAR